jgi:hypothetical protein
MFNALTQAIRNRDHQSAEAAIASLQCRMSRERVFDLLIASVEKLAWEEGDSVAAQWLLRRPAARSRY